MRISWMYIHLIILRLAMRQQLSQVTEREIIRLNGTHLDSILLWAIVCIVLELP
jgi:hypothetical protein